MSRHYIVNDKVALSPQKDDDDQGASSSSTSSDDMHVKELRRMFNCCDSDGDGAITRHGLERLCDELRLNEHKNYICEKIMKSNRLIKFQPFKLKFIQILPELVDFSSVTTVESAPSKQKDTPLPNSTPGATSGQKRNLFSTGNNDSTGPQENQQSNSKGQSRKKYGQRSNLRPIAAPRKKLFDPNMAATDDGAGADAPDRDAGPDGAGLISDQDNTSNDILSDFSDDDRRKKNRDRDTNTAIQKRINRSSLGSDSAGSSNASSENNQIFRSLENPATSAATITASDVEQILTGLGLADRGYLGRYEFRILCQHLGLSGLTSTELNGLFNQLDKDGDGRIAVNDFLLVCPTSSHSISTSQPIAPACEPVHQPLISTVSDEIHRQRTINSAEKIFPADGHTSPLAPVDSARSAIIDTTGVFGSDRSTKGNAERVSTTEAMDWKNGIGKNLDEKMKNLKTRAMILFGNLDENHTGHAKRADVLRYWETLRVENGTEILKRFGFSERQRWIDLRELSTSLDHELCDNLEHDATLLAAFLTYKAEICFLKESFDESSAQGSHYYRELQQLTQRNSILIEEMDQNQHNLELKSQLQLKELEEKYQNRVNNLENKYREEREQWSTEIRDKEEFVHKLEQSESNLQSRLRQLEKENSKLRTELDDLTQMMKDVEDLNRDLRQALKDATSIKKKQSTIENVLLSVNQSYNRAGNNVSTNRNSEEALRKVLAYDNGSNTPSSTGSRVGLVIHRSTTNKQQDAGSSGATCWKCASTSSTPAKKRVKYTPPSTSALLKRRRLQLQSQQNRRAGTAGRPLDSSDFDSEPEQLIFKPKFKRPLKKKQRLALIANRIPNDARNFSETGNALFSAAPMTSKSTSSSSSEGEIRSRAGIGTAAHGSTGLFFQNGAFGTYEGGKFINYQQNSGRVNENQPTKNSQHFERQLLDERKFYTQELKVEIAAMEEEHARESHRLLDRFEREKEQLKNEFRTELQAFIHSAAGEQRVALEQQEMELRNQFESEKRDAEIKWATEKNVMERKFAEEKMEMMERLQNDFEAELNRLRTAFNNRSRDNSTSPSVSMENRLRFDQVMQENSQLHAELDQVRNDLKILNGQVEDERNRNLKLEEQNSRLENRSGQLETRIGELEADVSLWESKFENTNQENATLIDRTRRLERDLHDVSTEFTVLQQRAEEFHRRSRVISSDVDVQTEASSYTLRDECVQSESNPEAVTTDTDVQISGHRYGRSDKTLARGVRELELLLQSAESGFEDDAGNRNDEMPRNETDTETLKIINGRLKNRLTRAHAKFEEIRSDLIEFTHERRPNSAPAKFEFNTRETQTDVGETCDGSRAMLAENRDTEKIDLDSDNQIGAIDDLNFEVDENEKDDNFDENMEINVERVSNSSRIAVAEITERLRDENFLLKSRLNEQRKLTGQLTEKLQQQMKDTVKVSEVAQKLFARCKSLESEQKNARSL